jgi:hypothetical protein
MNSPDSSASAPRGVAETAIELALENIARILTMPLPSPDDLSPEARLIRDLILSVAEVVIAKSRTALGGLH